MKTLLCNPWNTSYPQFQQISHWQSCEVAIIIAFVAPVYLRLLTSCRQSFLTNLHSHLFAWDYLIHKQELCLVISGRILFLTPKLHSCAWWSITTNPSLLSLTFFGIQLHGKSLLPCWAWLFLAFSFMANPFFPSPALHKLHHCTLYLIHKQELV